jgi:hypothetical protein
MLTAGERKQRAKIGAYAMHAQGKTNTGPARAAGEQRFITLAAAEAAERGEQISEQELRRRALALRKLFFARIAFQSIKARKANGKRLASTLIAAPARENGTAPTPTFAGAVQREVDGGLSTTTEPAI